MSKIADSISHYLQGIPDRIRKIQILVWLLFLALTVFAFMGIMRAKFDMTIEGWFPSDDPVKVAMDDFKAQFGSDDAVYIVYKPTDGDVFSARSLRAIQSIRDELINGSLHATDSSSSALKHIVKVSSLVSASFLAADGDALVSSKLVGKDIPTDKAELEAIRATAKAQRAFPKVYFSEDMKYGGILIETDFGTELDDSAKAGETAAALTNVAEMEDLTATPAVGQKQKVHFKPTDANEYFALMKAIDSVFSKPEYKAKLSYYAVGNAAMAYENLNILNRESGPIYLGLLLIIAGLIWWFTRSMSAVVWSLTIIVCSVIWTIGLGGWLGLDLTAFVVLTVMLVLTVGVCDSAHIFSAFLTSQGKGLSRWESIRDVYKNVSTAILLTAFTNITGMLACVVAPIPRLKVFGFMSAAGVLFALIFTLFLLPLMMNIWAPKPVIKHAKPSRFNLGRYVPNMADFMHKFLTKVPGMVERRPYMVALPFMIVFAMTLVGATKVKVNTDLATQFPEKSPFRHAVELIDQKMMGSQNMEIFVDLGKENAFQDPFVLAKLDALQRKLEQKYPNVIVRTSSLVEVVKDASRTLNGGKQEMYALPSDPTLLSQNLYLFNMAAPEDRRRLVSDDYSKSHITVNMLNIGSNEYMKIYRDMTADIDAAVAEIATHYPNSKANITGLLPLNMKFAEYVATNEVQGFGIALISITITLMFVFGSVSGGLIAVIPNLIPSTLTFGLLGWWGKSLDFDVMVLVPVVVGITVDDTVHFISHYRHTVLHTRNVGEALRLTIREVGQATAFTSLILGLGFSVMAFSDIQGTANIGKFGTLAIFIGMLNDIFLLPSLIYIFKPTFGMKMSTAPNHATQVAELQVGGEA